MSNDEVFWSSNPFVLINPMFLHRFFPSEYFNTEARMNSIMRLSIYIGIALSMVRQSMTWMLLPIVSGLFTLSWMHRENPRATEFNMSNDLKRDNKYKKHLVNEILTGNVAEYIKKYDKKSNKKKRKRDGHNNENSWIDTNITSRIYEDVDTVMQKTQEERAELTDKYSRGIANSTKFARKMMKLDRTRIEYNKRRFS